MTVSEVLKKIFCLVIEVCQSWQESFREILNLVRLVPKKTDDKNKRYEVKSDRLVSTYL